MTFPDESLLVNSAAGHGASNVFIYLTKAPQGTKSPVPNEPVVMDQKGCIFLPHAIARQILVAEEAFTESD